MEKVMGVYFIRNTVNDKVYVGSSNNIVRRWSCHKQLLVDKKHENAHLQSSWNLYGEHKFKFELIETIKREQNLLKREHYYIEGKKSYMQEYGYNISRFPLAPMRGLVAWNKGKKLSKKHAENARKARKYDNAMRKKIRKSVKKLWKQGVYSEERNKKISKTLSGRPTGRKGKHYNKLKRKYE